MCWHCLLDPARLLANPLSSEFVIVDLGRVEVMLTVKGKCGLKAVAQPECLSPQASISTNRIAFRGKFLDVIAMALSENFAKRPREVGRRFFSSRKREDSLR